PPHACLPYPTLFRSCLNVMYAASVDGGKSWGTPTTVTSTPTNLNYEQFGGRLVPFFGDYITVAAQGSTIGAVWTDQRNTVGAAEDRKSTRLNSSHLG